MDDLIEQILQLEYYNESHEEGLSFSTWTFNNPRIDELQTKTESELRKILSDLD